MRNFASSHAKQMCSGDAKCLLDKSLTFKQMKESWLIEKEQIIYETPRCLTSLLNLQQSVNTKSSPEKIHHTSAFVTLFTLKI